MTALPRQAFASVGVMGRPVRGAMAHFGIWRLSDREAEVARLILQGHSSKITMQTLGNSHETVKVFRRRIYARGWGLTRLLSCSHCFWPPFVPPRVAQPMTR